MSYQLVAKAATCATHNIRKNRTCIPSAGFEPAIPLIKRMQKYALDGMASGIGIKLEAVHNRLGVLLHIICLHICINVNEISKTY